MNLKSIPVHFQILGAFLTLQGIVLAASLSEVHRLQTRLFESEARANLERAKNVFDDMAVLRRQELARDINTFKKDGALLLAPLEAGPGPARARLVLQRIKNTITRADQILITDSKGVVTASTIKEIKPGTSLAALPPVAGALKGEAGFGLHLLGKASYRIVCIPVQVAKTRMLVVEALVNDDGLAERSKRLIGTEVSFMLDGHIISSTLGLQDRGLLERQYRTMKLDQVSLFGSPGHEQIVIPVSAGHSIGYLQTSMDRALAPLKKFKPALLLIGLAGIALTALIGFVIARGITDSIQQLIEKLTQLNDIKSKFFSMVTHDVRNPLSGILSGVELLQSGTDDRHRKRVVGIIRNSSKTLDFLVSDLVDFAAMESGKLRMDIQPMDLAEVLSDIAARMDVLAKKKDIRFIVKTESKAIPMEGDPRRIAQVLQNLSSNAINYTPPKGTVTLQVRSLPDEVGVEVKDTGIGIAREDLPKIFGRFYQAENAKKAHSGGFGLGLTITQEIVRAHGGSVSVESELGKGSVFRLTLPRHPAVVESPDS